MPTYEYICTGCSKKFSLIATIKEKEEGLNPVCPQCGSMEVKQSYSGIFFAVKGVPSSASCTSSTCGTCKTCK